MMPAGLGGLVATIEHTTGDSAATRGMSPVAARAALASDAARADQLRGEFARAQASGMTAEAARAAGFAPEVVRALAAARPSVRVPQLSYIASRGAAPAASTALGATAASEPAALQHVAWADRWLARFAGASAASLDTWRASAGSLEGWHVPAGSPSLELRPLARAGAAPETVFVAPSIADAAPAADARPILRFDDDAETPDDVFASIAAASARSRASRTCGARQRVRRAAARSLGRRFAGRGRAA